MTDPEPVSGAAEAFRIMERAKLEQARSLCQGILKKIAGRAEEGYGWLVVEGSTSPEVDRALGLLGFRVGSASRGTMVSWGSEGGNEP